MGFRVQGLVQLTVLLNMGLSINTFHKLGRLFWGGRPHNKDCSLLGFIGGAQKSSRLTLDNLNPKPKPFEIMVYCSMPRSCKSFISKSGDPEKVLGLMGFRVFRE